MPQFPVMIFAAGFGTRMGALTKNRPKPLITVAGKTLLDHALDLTDLSQVSRVVVNAHYKADQIVRHLAGRRVAISHEREAILETGGGLRAALPILIDDTVITLNSDAVWTGRNPLQELCDAWRPDQMDALLLLAPVAAIKGHAGKGDFLLDQSGRISRANGRDGLIYLGAQILRTGLLGTIPQPVFSLNILWDKIIAERRAYAIIHHGGWCDVGRPENIAEAESLLIGSSLV
jgi:MurNAc alpha-1-phosphate uridylyltransferase